MKNSIMISAVLLFTYTVQAQKISFGLMVPVYSLIPLPLQERPCAVGYDLAPSLNFITNKTHHHLRYGATNNEIQAINGYFFNNFDIYCFYAKNLNNKKNYLGVGVEKGLQVGNNFFIFPFAEIGTNFKKPIFSFGVVFHPFIKIR